MNHLTYHYDFAHQFLNIASSSIDEMEKRENRIFSIIPDTGDEQQNLKIHEERMKWSDINISLPIIFSFYHGVELFMKALMFDLDNNYQTNHKLTSLLKDIKTLNNRNLNGIIICINDILDNSPFKSHFRENEKTIDEFYHILKYAEDLKGNYTSIGTLVGKEEKGLKNFLILRKQINHLRTELKKWKMSQINNI